MASPETIRYLTWLTDLGPLTALATDRGLAALHLQPIDPGQAAQALSPGARLLDEPDSHLTAARDQVTEYMAGQRREFDIKLDLRGTDFQLAVWRQLLKLSFGQLVSYGGLAQALGRPKSAARAVGGAVGSNPVPIIVPCHRVIAADGGLGGFSSGLSRKLILLGVEGITEADLRERGDGSWSG